ncbi:MAG: 7-carboxy-7-deazaguanine synthase QueE [Bacteroidota bacterium]|nr:7-carboxy-7-deazaguanine synthase QueE [Bacteroidota bacterium]
MTVSVKNTSDEELMEKGELLPIVEDFYTIQGEGYHTGKAAYFIRIGGCDVGCSWCDSKVSWNPDVHPLVSTNDVIKRASEYPAKAVVVTGGEPLMYNLDYLCRGLKDKDIQTFIETSGSHPFSGEWDWVCLSPKKQSPPLEEFYSKADELKVIIMNEEDLQWAEENAEKVNHDCLLYLQPEWSHFKTIIPVLVDYVKQHPKWLISLQSHKFMRIP